MFVALIGRTIVDFNLWKLEAMQVGGLIMKEWLLYVIFRFFVKLALLYRCRRKISVNIGKTKKNIWDLTRGRYFFRDEQDRTYKNSELYVDKYGEDVRNANKQRSDVKIYISEYYLRKQLPQLAHNIKEAV